jgi:hypothetical protein
MNITTRFSVYTFPMLIHVDQNVARNYTVKGEAVAVRMGNGGIAPYVRSLGGGSTSCPVSLLNGKSPHCPLNRRLDEPQNRSGCLGEEKNLLLWN